MRTDCVSLKKKRNGMIEVTTSRPNVTFQVEPEKLDNPYTFKSEMWAKAHARPSGPLWGQGRFLPQTRGQADRMWQEWLDAGK